MFLAAALKPLSEFNTAFQSEEVQIHRLEEEMCRLIRRILGGYQPGPSHKGVHEKKIFQSVRRFYEAVLQKMFSSFSLDNPLLRDLKVLDPIARLDFTPGAVERLVALLSQLSLSEDKLREKLIDYQLTDSKQL
ncbi:Hypothetical predicted protein [Podarcis lilfordi]|uniref:Uncharacterized protein n=1 Tax=Podarcis lilfordi TaxID=74358 RepID=A0AA35KXE5_9SAUR|nr:Hypothetical predicted protein [Podarcis lilfordi]